MENETQYVSIINGYTIKDKEAREELENMPNYDDEIASINDDIYNLKELKPTSVNFAHRGLSSEAPENTLAAIYKAGYHHCYGVEIDIQMTSDNKIVVMHDETVDRTTNGTGTVNELTSTYIRTLSIDAGNCVECFPTQQVPFLEEALDVCYRFGMIPMLELKGAWSSSQIELLLDIINEYNMLDKVIIISFEDSHLRTVRAINSDVRLAKLFSNENGIDSPAGEEVIDLCVELGKCDISMYHGYNTNISDATLTILRNNKIKYGFWTMNTQSNVNDIITNNKGTAFIVSDYGYGGSLKQFTKLLDGTMTENDGFMSWPRYSPAGNMAFFYDDFTIEEVGTSKYYNITFTTPLSGIGAYNSCLINFNMMNYKAYKYHIVCRGQNNTGFTMYIYDNEGTLVDFDDIYEDAGQFWLHITITGYTQ